MVVAAVMLPSQGCCEWVGGEKSGGAQGRRGACLGVCWAYVLQGDFCVPPLQARSISMLRRSSNPPTAPEVEEGRNSPWETQKTLRPVSYTRWSHSSVCYRPSPVVPSHQYPCWW